MDYVKFLSVNPFQKINYFGTSSFVDDFLKFYSFLYYSNFVELDFSYLDFMKYKYIARNYSNNLLKYIILNNNHLNIGKAYSNNALNLNQHLFLKKDVDLNLMHYWMHLKPSKRFVTMPWNFFSFNDIWLKNIYFSSFASTDKKLYKYAPLNMNLPLLSYIDKYGSYFGSIDDVFEYHVNKFVFNFKFNSFIVKNLDFLRI